jgi:outer membrane autotransporter protein
VTLALTCAKIKSHGSASDSADTGATAWAQILGNRGYLSSDANAGRVNYSAQMLMLGLDHQLDNELRLGALGTIGHNTIQQPAGAASNHVDALHIGLYLVKTWNEFGLRARISRRFASDDLMPSARMAWATGSRGSSFEVGGAPLARDAILLEAGVTVQVNLSGLF